MHAPFFTGNRSYGEYDSPKVAMGVLAVLLALTAPAVAWCEPSPRPAASVTAGGAGLPTVTLEDRALAEIRARNADGATPVGGHQHTGVTLWDERGSPAPSSQRHQHSDGTGNRQNHYLQLGQ
jgi:hypothetical protein